MLCWRQSIVLLNCYCYLVFRCWFSYGFIVFLKDRGTRGGPRRSQKGRVQEEVPGSISIERIKTERDRGKQRIRKGSKEGKVREKRRNKKEEEKKMRREKEKKERRRRSWRI